MKLTCSDLWYLWNLYISEGHQRVLPGYLPVHFYLKFTNT